MEPYIEPYMQRPQLGVHPASRGGVPDGTATTEILTALRGHCL